MPVVASGPLPSLSHSVTCSTGDCGVSSMSTRRGGRSPGARGPTRFAVGAGVLTLISRRKVSKVFDTPSNMPGRSTLSRSRLSLSEMLLW